jgi:hypothetical protein
MRAIDFPWGSCLSDSYFAKTVSAAGHAGVKLPPQYCSTLAQSTLPKWGHIRRLLDAGCSE